MYKVTICVIATTGVTTHTIEFNKLTIEDALAQYMEAIRTKDTIIGVVSYY